MNPDGLHENLHYADAGAIGVAVATFFGWLPNIAALLSVVWLCIRIYETKTVQRMLYGNTKGADDGADED